MSKHEKTKSSINTLLETLNHCHSITTDCYIDLPGATASKFVGGFLPLHKFERVHTAFLVIDNLVYLFNNLEKNIQNIKMENNFKGNKNICFYFL